MDPPDLFGDLYDDDAYEEEPPVGEKSTRRPQEPRSQPPPAIPSPRVKDASVLLPESPEMAPALALADDRGDLVTSGREGYSGDGVHAATSQHYQGLAIDLRFTGDRERQAAAYRDLGYVAIVEKDHVHVQRYPRA
jgi:hypothetical protein